MKNYTITLFVAVSILLSCTTPQTVVKETQTVYSAPISYVVDDYYILMSDVFHLKPGMTYKEVKVTLKQDPFEIHQNINDNCIILAYHMKRNNRIHTADASNENEVPMLFYYSVDPANLTFSESQLFYLILDSNQKILRTFFSEPNSEHISKYTQLLQRSKKVCDDPKVSGQFLSLWTIENPADSSKSESTVKLNLFKK